jgi:hypothetical protein
MVFFLFKKEDVVGGFYFVVGICVVFGSSEDMLKADCSIFSTFAIAIVWSIEGWVLYAGLGWVLICLVKKKNRCLDNLLR